MIGRVRDRATFEALARAGRVQRGAITLRYVASHGDGVPRAAFAIGRGTGGAVRRNRARRRLRAALLDVADELEPGGAYLVGAGAGVVTMPYDALRDQLRAVVRAAAETR
ncbi:MAG TPA: ribonuclease P protein component [Actinomycetota bacterium]|nr:ribonuclease P protein component [Actinomycetota bacterium]